MDRGVGGKGRETQGWKGGPWTDIELWLVQVVLSTVLATQTHNVEIFFGGRPEARPKAKRLLKHLSAHGDDLPRRFEEGL